MRKVAFYVLNGFAVLATMFISGYAFEDPGGWQAAGMTAAYVVPMIAVVLLTWRFPQAMRIPLIVLAGISIIVSASQAVWLEQWKDFLNRVGPVEAIGSFVVVMGLNAYARYHDELLGGALMFAVAVTPIAALYFGTGMQRGVLGGSTTALLLPGVIAGATYIIDSELARPAQRKDIRRGASATG